MKNLFSIEANPDLIIKPNEAADKLLTEFKEMTKHPEGDSSDFYSYVMALDISIETHGVDKLTNYTREEVKAIIGLLEHFKPTAYNLLSNKANRKAN